MAIFTAIGAAIFGAGTFLAGATAFGLQMAAGIGMNLLAQKVAGKKNAPQAQGATSGPGYSVQGKLSSGADIPRSFPLGFRCTAGSLVYANTWGSSGDTPNAYLTQVIAVSDMPVSSASGINGLVGMFVNGERVTFGETPHADRGYPVIEYRKGGKDYLWVKFYDGRQTEADAFLVNTVSSAERPYESTRVGVGVAYAIVTSLVKDDLFSGFPSFKFETLGIPLYDISKDTTQGGDGPQRWDDPSTWGGDGDQLPIVQIYNIQRGVRFDGDWLYGLQGLSAARLPAANWIAQIEKCREAVDGPDGEGSEPRYRASLECHVSNEIAETIEQLLTACQGRLSEIGGVYKIHCGAPDDPVMSLTDDDIISTQEQSFTPFFGLADTVNGINAKYPNPAQGWNTQVAPPIYRPDLEELAGGRRLMADVPLDAVPYARQVQQLMQEALQEAQRARRHTFVLPPRFWPLEPGDIVEWTSARNGYATKQFRVDGIVDRADLDVMVDLTEVDPADYDFNFDNDYTPVVEGPLIVVRPPAQAIADFDASPYIVRDNLGLPRRSSIICTWDAATDDIVGVQYEVRLASDHTQIVTGRFNDAGAGSGIVPQDLLPNTNYQARGRYIPGSPRETTWSGWINVTTPDSSFSLEDFNAALRYELNTKLAQIRAELDASNNLLATLIAEQEAANQEDKTRVINEIIRARGNLRAAWTKDISVAVGPNSAIAEAIEQVSAAVGNVEANLKVRFVAGVAPEGALAQYDAVATAESALAGLSIIAFDDGMGGAYGQVRIVGDRFYVTGTGAGAVPVFIVDTEAVPPKIYLNGDIIAPGSITAAMISAGAIDAISANIRIVNSEQIEAGVVKAVNIESDYAIFNKAKSLASPLTLQNVQVQFGNTTITEQDVLRASFTVGQEKLIWFTASFIMGAGTQQNGTYGYASVGQPLVLSIELSVKKNNVEITRLVMSSVSDASSNPTTNTALPSNQNGRAASTTQIVGTALSTGDQIEIALIKKTTTTWNGGTQGNYLFNYVFNQANIMILGPNGV